MRATTEKARRGANLHVLIVSQYFWPEDFRVNDLALGLVERGHQVTVLTGMPNYPGGQYYPGYGPFGPRGETHEGIRVVRAPLVSRGRGKGVRLALNYLSFALSASLLGPIYLRKMRFDLIFVFEPSPITVGLPALIMKAFTRAPVMFWVLDLWPESLSAAGAITSESLLQGVEGLVRFIYRRCDRVLVSSPGFVPQVKKLGATPDAISWFPQWAERFYRPLAVEEGSPEASLLPPGFRILFAGNIGAAQSFPTVLEAAERLRAYRDIHWIILGDGRMRSWVEAQVTARGLTSTVHWLGRHPAESMPRWFALADALLLTLKRDPIFSLTVPAKLQSYLACAKPIVAAIDGEGARVVQEAGAGLTCDSEDAEGLAQAALALYRAEEGERLAMGRRGRSCYDANFEREILLDRLHGWMEELVRERGRG